MTKDTAALKTTRDLIAFGARYRKSAMADIAWSVAQTCIDYCLGELEDEGEIGTAYKCICDFAEIDSEFEETREIFGAAFGKEIAEFGILVNELSSKLKEQL